MDDEIILIKETFRQDKIGNAIADTQRKPVFCKVKSIDRTEFYQAGQKGLKPAYKFTMFKGDYEGEQLVEYHGVNYAVYRSYEIPDSDDLELYVKDKEGITWRAQ